MDKKASLEELKGRIESELGKENIWLFPKGECDYAEIYFQTELGRRVEGFWGTGENPDFKDTLMIIAERPSIGYGEKPKRFDKRIARFYEFLDKYKLHNSHLTDFIKTRARVGYDVKKQQKLEFYEGEFAKHLPVLKEEMHIIQPTRIVAMGEKTYLWVALCKSFWELRDVKLTLSPHYAYRFKKWEELEKEILASINPPA